MATKKLKRGVLPLKNQRKGVWGTIHISPSTPLPAALKKVDKKLLHGKVRVLGMSRAIQTVLQIAAALKARKYGVEIHTLSMTAVDEVVDEKKGTSVMSKRAVPSVELLVVPQKLP